MPDLQRAAILVTGATGFVGAALTRGLLAAGASPSRLRCLVRDGGRAMELGVPQECVRVGDVTQPDSLRAPVAGVDLVYHVAGVVKAARAKGFFAVNAEGAQNLAAAARQSAPQCHFVLVSSLSAAGPSPDGAGSDAPPAQCRPVSTYGESKRRGELAVASSALAHTIVRPPVVYGPGDAATQFMFKLACASFCAVPFRPRPLSVMHVQDLVDALLRAGRTAPCNAILPLDGPQRTDTHALMRAMAAAAGRRARLLPVPMAVAAVAAGVADLWAAMVERASFFSGDKVRELRAAGWVADGAAARRVLGFEAQVDLVAGLRAVAAAEGLVRPGRVRAAGPA